MRTIVVSPDWLVAELGEPHWISHHVRRGARGTIGQSPPVIASRFGSWCCGCRAEPSFGGQGAFQYQPCPNHVDLVTKFEERLRAS